MLAMIILSLRMKILIRYRVFEKLPYLYFMFSFEERWMVTAHGDINLRC